MSLYSILHIISFTFLRSTLLYCTSLYPLLPFIPLLLYSVLPLLPFFFFSYSLNTSSHPFPPRPSSPPPFSPPSTPPPLHSLPLPLPLSSPFYSSSSLPKPSLLSLISHYQCTMLHRQIEEAENRLGESSKVIASNQEVSTLSSDPLKTPHSWAVNATLEVTESRYHKIKSSSPLCVCVCLCCR